MKPQEKEFFKDKREEKEFKKWYNETMKKAYEKQSKETNNPKIKKIIEQLISQLEIC